MRNPFLIVIAGVAVGAVLFGGAFLGTRHLCVEHAAQSTDDLDWLRMEFNLDAADIARVRELHEGYLPICERNCQAIAAKKTELTNAIAAGTNSAETLDQLRAQVVDLRTKCQNEMLAHFEEVGRAMPPEQGKRYLAEMKRLTLGEHEQVEASMSGTNGHGHDQH